MKSSTFDPSLKLIVPPNVIECDFYTFIRPKAVVIRATKLLQLATKSDFNAC